MKINEFCRNCLLRKNLQAYPPSASPEQAAAYQKEVRSILDRCSGLSAPEITEKMDNLRWDMFGERKDFSGIKQHFNDLMLSLEPHMEQQIRNAEDPLKRAVQYAMAGNYIDFAVVKNVSEDQLREKLDTAAGISIDPKILDDFRSDAPRARRLVYFTDNCGEIVADKLLIKALRSINPKLTVTVIVRGKPVVNDATLEDAMQIRLSEAAHCVIGNGTGMPGNVIGIVSPEAPQEIRQADLLISKGQGNFEGLSGCGLNIFYLFLCKCDRFMNLFQVPQFTGVMTREGISF